MCVFSAIKSRRERKIERAAAQENAAFADGKPRRMKSGAGRCGQENL